MKPIVKKIWISIAVLCTFLNASAYDFESDGLCYYIRSEKDRTVGVTYKGYQKYFGDIEIPEKVICKSKTYTVTAIGDYAFRECSSLTSVTIPNSVTYIGDYAFGECSSLTSVTIPNSVTYIGDSAFYGCSSLTSVTIPNSVTAIERHAFRECSSLTSVTIPNSVTAIGRCAFYGCSNLTSVTIPNSVTAIGEYAFKWCSSLTSVTIPNSVAAIGEEAFSGCRSLESINIDPGNANYSSIYGILYNKDATSLICCPGAKATAAIPNSVTSIGEYAFSWCRSLTSVTIPNSVTTIGDYAFEECQSLKSIYMLCEVPIECSPSFEKSSLKEAVLYVPTGTKTEYEKVDPWRNFWNIVETDFSGINGIEADEYGVPHISVNNGILTIDGIDSHESVTVYDMQGRIFYNGTSHTIDDLSSGLYIVKAGSRTIKISI